MTNRVREILDFAQLEPEASGDLEQMIAEFGPAELALIDQIAGNLANAVRSVKANRFISKEKNRDQTDN